MSVSAAWPALSSARPRSRSALVVLVGSAGTLLAWLAAALTSSRALAASLPLVVLQALLATVCFYIITRRLTASGVGPTVVVVLSLHALMYYGLSNVMPALFAERRPAELELVIRIPTSPTAYYSISTIGALLFLLGSVLGAMLPWKVLTPASGSVASLRERQWAWLPGYWVATWSCIVLLGVVIVATAEFGLRFDATMLVEGVTATFSPFQLVLWGGIFYFLPIAPVLAAAAVVQARDRRHRRAAMTLMVFAMLLSLAVLTVWRMRSTSMIAVLLPVALLVHAGFFPLRKTILPGVVAMIVIYVGVTFVRLSQVAEVLATSTGGSVSLTDVLSAVGEQQGSGIVDKAMFDLSYRAAGLEGVAAIVQAEDEHRTRVLAGRSTVAGFAQSLPGPLRGQVGIPERIKTAPSVLGIFGESDWVTTFLAELALDFGPFALLGPAILVGFLFGLVDCLLFVLGNHSPALEGILILRLPWLLTFILMGSSAGDLVAYFFKANAGYALLLVLVSAFVAAAMRRPLRAAREGIPARQT